MTVRAADGVDAVVVGSGFGGSVVASRLAEAGQSVLLLERGRAHPFGSFPRTPAQLATAFWDPDAGLYGLFEVWGFRRLNVVVASGLGGGSLVYANVLTRKDADTFVRDDGRPWPVSRPDLDPHYERVEAVLTPTPFPFGCEPYRSTPKTRAMTGAAERLGFDCDLPPLAVSFRGADGTLAPGRLVTEAEPNLFGRPRLTCRLCGECNLGCNDGAKNTLDLTYLSRALRAGAVLRTCAEVQTIIQLAGGGYELTYLQHTAARSGQPEQLLDPDGPARRRIRTRRVVLAAGTLGSTRLLLANRVSLPRLSPVLGTRVSANGDAIVWLRGCSEDAEAGVARPRIVDQTAGPVITVSLRPRGGMFDGGRVIVQDAGAPAFTSWILHTMASPGMLWRLAAAAPLAAASRLGGRRPTRRSRSVAALFADARSSTTLLPLLGMGPDTAEGRLRLRGDTLDLEWTGRLSAAHHARLDAAFRAVADALGGTVTTGPFRRLTPITTVHPLGGCPMGDSRDDGVVDGHGRVFGHPGLYVADGSVMPAAIGRNPGLTIAAFADRCADAVIDDIRT